MYRIINIQTRSTRQKAESVPVGLGDTSYPWTLCSLFIAIKLISHWGLLIRHFLVFLSKRFKVSATGICYFIDEESVIVFSDM